MNAFLFLNQSSAITPVLKKWEPNSKLWLNSWKSELMWWFCTVDPMRQLWSQPLHLTWCSLWKKGIEQIKPSVFQFGECDGTVLSLCSNSSSPWVSQISPFYLRLIGIFSCKALKLLTVSDIDKTSLHVFCKSKHAGTSCTKFSVSGKYWSNLVRSQLAPVPSGLAGS